MNFDQTRFQEIVGLQSEYWNRKFFHYLREMTNLGADAPEVNFEYYSAFVCGWTPICIKLSVFV